MILIIGCGYLGSYLLQKISKNTNEPVIATLRNFKKIKSDSFVKYIYCDVTDTESLKNLSAMCNNEELTVFYLASCHNIDYVFENPQQAKRININGLENFFKVFPNIKKFFYASTDCVYGEGKNHSRKFKEYDTLYPINEYGKQKSEAEKIIFGYGHKVFRLPFMLGPSLNNKPHFYDNIKSSLLSGKTVEMIDGMRRSVLSYDQVAEIMYKLSLLPYNKLPHVINICGDDLLSKHEIGCIIADKLGVSSELIIKISEHQGEKFFKDKRASCTHMDNALVKSLLDLDKIEYTI